MKITFFLAWFDLWIGAYYDRKKRILYICPLPMCVVKIALGRDELHVEEFGPFPIDKELLNTIDLHRALIAMSFGIDPEALEEQALGRKENLNG